MSARPGLRSHDGRRYDTRGQYQRQETPPPIGFKVPETPSPRPIQHLNHNSPQNWNHSPPNIGFNINQSYESSTGHHSSFEGYSSSGSFQVADETKIITDDEDDKQKRPREKSVVPSKHVAPNPQAAQQFNWNIIIGIVVVAIIVFFGVRLITNQSPEDPLLKEAECKQGFKRLMQDHQEQEEDVIRSIFAASKNMLKGKESAVQSIVLLYSSQSSMDFVEDTLASTVSCTPTGKSTPIVLRRENFTAQMEEDPGHVLNLFGNQLKNERIMLVRDVDTLPMGVAPAFHVICDSDSPWARPATVYFTIEIPKDTVVTPENMDRLAIHRLERSWTGLPANILDPLITRITNQVLYIH